MSHFKLNPSKVNAIKKRFHEEEHIVRIIELWYESTPSQECTWSKLKEGSSAIQSVFESSVPPKHKTSSYRTYSSSKLGK